MRMLYPKNIENKIGFDKIRECLKQECVSALGSYFVDKIQFIDDFELLGKWLGQTEEFRQIILGQEAFPSSNYIDVRRHLDKVRIEGAFLSEDEFFDLKLSLDTILKCVVFLKEKADHYRFLAELTQMVGVDKRLLQQIEEKIDERGHLRNNASAELAEIRRNLIAEQAKIRNVLERILRQAREDGYTPDDVSLTIRGGRMVIPVSAEYKRRIKGFIHDESATGQTVYIEPAEALEINNEIRDLEYRERREIVRILTELTNKVRPYLLELKKAYTFLGIIDFVRAKARFSLKIDAVTPQIEPLQVIDWFNARHPLLQLSLQAQGKKIVPLNIHLKDGNRILVISGPNAGGKSVCLKTVALLQYMIQCGLPIPLMEHSKVGIFKSIFIDIGDEQSIENDLSTYSSHLANMKHFVSFSDRKTLFLIDEFGTGTEPQFGGAIAEAILKDLVKKQAFGVITTHYSNLKQFADRIKGVVNAAMRYDVEHLEPLYALEIGKPGSSFALEIAKKIGLPSFVIQEARNTLGEERVNFDQMLRELEIEKKKFAEKNVSIAEKETRLKVALQEYTDLKVHVENQKKKILNEAKEQARALLKEANKKIEETIRVIREKKADKEVSKEVRNELADFKQKLAPEDVEPNYQQHIKVIQGEIKEGDLVKIKGQETVAEVLSLRGKDAELKIGVLKSTIKLNRLEKISKKEYKKAMVESDATATPSLGVNLNSRFAEFSPNLDLRGKRAEEALSMLAPFIDDAVMFGISEVRIIHGKGDGILRKVVRDHLRTFSSVRGAFDEHVERGGAGVTIVALK
jgi:DNA mismatch repair protein MutS2